ncbi:MAG: putative DNA binding domain-containing protein [Bacteroidia bacterium]|nr:putative DNA binding domain-containing protein [Bacteroidia bacterium]
METIKIIETIERGYETSTVQYKVTLNNINQLVQELVAFSNTLGGLLIIGVADNGEVQGIASEAIRKFNQWIGSAASDLIKPPISPLTQVISVQGKDILVVEVPKGINLPYYTHEGVVYIKKGSDKRIAQPEEVLRMFQQSAKIFADEMVIISTSFNNMNIDTFKKFIKKKTKKSFHSIKLSMSQVLNNMGLAKDKNLTLAGLLLFGNNPQRYKPMFTVQCISYIGNEISGSEFRDNEHPFEGNIVALFEKTMNFITRNLHKVQVEKSFNSIGQLEIPEKVFEEFIVNALVHRDYFISSTIKVFIFDNRIEIISPGKLPNRLSIENIKTGTSNVRNPILFTNARYLLPFTGVGSGIPRAISLYPEIDFINDQEREIFIVVIKRP